MNSNSTIAICGRGDEKEFSKWQPFFIIIEIGGVILLLIFLSCLKLVVPTRRNSFPLIQRNNQNFI